MELTENKEMTKELRKVVDDAKLKIRTDLTLKEWTKYKIAKYWDMDLDNSFSSISKSLPRFHVSERTTEEFQRDFESPNLPCVIEGMTEDWPGKKLWNFESLRARYGNGRFKCGEDDDGYTVRMTLNNFLDYMEVQRDDSPLYIFEGAFDDSRSTSRLLEEYTPPSYFRDDLFNHVKEKRRPPYRWFLIGPKRSGTCVHIDPLGTSAWNTLIVGRKRWVLFPPEVSKKIVKGAHHIKKGEDDEASSYFMYILPRIIRECKSLGITPIEFIQQPGETMFIPGGWWHAVLNLDDTIAVTQNFCSTVNFPKVWRETRVGRKGMCRKWLNTLTEKVPQISKRAHAINEKDGYVMPTKDELREMKEAKKAKKRAERKKRKRKNSMSKDKTKKKKLSMSS